MRMMTTQVGGGGLVVQGSAHLSAPSGPGITGNLPASPLPWQTKPESSMMAQPKCNYVYLQLNSREEASKGLMGHRSKSAQRMKKYREPSVQMGRRQDY